MRNRAYVTSVFFAFLIATIVVTFFAIDRSAEGQQKPIKKYSELPMIISDVETLQIIDEANLKEEGTIDAFVEFKIKNNSYKPIIAFTIESGDDKNASGQMTTGIIGDEPPIIVIQPSEIYKMHYLISNVTPGFPIRIGGVLYADGTEDGKEKVLKSMRRKIEHNKTLIRQKEKSLK